MPDRVGRWLALVMAVGLVAGCSGSDSEDAGATTVAGAALTTAAGGGAGAGEQTGGTEGTAAPPVLDARQIVYTATVRLQADDPAAVAEQAVDVAVRRGGAVFDQTVSRESTPFASVVLKVPPAELRATIADLSALGEVVDLNQRAEDVTAQVVDLESRIKTAAASVERLRGFLIETTDVGEVASLERELVTRETELESLRAQQRTIAGQVALATVTLEVSLSADALRALADTEEEDDGLPTVGDALRAGGRAFVVTLQAIGVVLAWSLPFVAVALVLGALWWVIRRRARRSLRPAASASPPAPASPSAPEKVR